MSRGGDNGVLPPLRAPPRRAASRNSNDYDLSELSPRPSSPLLSPNHENESVLSADTRSEWRDSKSRKGKGKAVAYAEPLQQWPPVSVMDRMRGQREARQAPRDKTSRGPRAGTRSHNLPSWTPPLPSDYHGYDEDEYHHDGQYRKNEVSAQNQGGYASGMSIMGSMLLGRTSSGPESQPTVEVDNTFRNIQRREKQLQNELQKLLDAQGAALERQISGDAPLSVSDSASGTASRRSSASQSPRRSRIEMYDRSAPLPAVMPVRQPKPKRLSLRQVRNSIARAMSMLTDLKEEENQCIMESKQARVAAIAKANRLSSQYKTIASNLRALESDKDDPLRRQMESMQDEYKQVCGDIEDFEQKLRALKRTKGQLEQKMEEVRSERESGLSGYRGALKETERGIGEMMKRPGVRVLELDDDYVAADADAAVPETEAAADDDEETQANKTKQAYMQQRLTGQEFMRLRPERRTLAMAKEWWEGEIDLLARRQAAVDHELEALQAGMEVWADVTGQIQEYEARLAGALGSLLPSAPGEKDRTGEKMLLNQYRDLKSTMAQLEDQLRFVESKGWNLLLAAIGAELTGFAEGEKVLQQIMESQGVDFAAVEAEYEKPVAPNGFVDGGESRTPTGPRVAERATGNDDETNKKGPKARTPGTEELTGSVIRLWGEPDLAPSQSSPGPSSPRRSPAPSTSTSSRAPSPPRPSAAEEKDDATVASHDDNDGATHAVPPHHDESSDNEVPFGLLSERPRRADDDDDESDDEEHANEVPPEFLSIHAEAGPRGVPHRAGEVD